MKSHRTSCHPKRRHGFSLLEMLAVTTLIGIVAAVIVPRLGQIGSHAKSNVCHQYKADLNTAAEKYFLATGDFPRQDADLADDEYYGPVVPVCPVDGSSYQFNPSSGRVTGHTH